MKIYSIIKKSCAAIVLLAMSGCNSWMDIYPENQQSSDQYWQSKEEVYAVLMGAYTNLRNSYQTYIQWGELRGDGIDLLSTSGDAYKIKNLDINISNSICKYSSLYTTIARANAVIKYSPGVIEKDITFTEGLSNSYIAEAIFIRTLCYFYLVRTFDRVPLVLEPYVDDSQGFNVQVAERNVILNQLISDLKKYAPMCKPGYEVDWQNKGRATSWACYALLADICLWKGDYDQAIQACNKVISSQRYSLVSNEEWYTLYYPGNSIESIFELQWSNEFEQTNSLYTLFYNETNNATYKVSGATRALFEDESIREVDVRGKAGSYLADATYDSKIWKYAGTGIYGADGEKRGTSERDANWIVYRYADILLIKAEALVMKGQENYQEAFNLVKEIRTRAGHTIDLDFPVSEQEALNMVINERQREFVAEGKRWFDILRVASRNSFTTYKSYLTDVLLENVAAKDRPQWEAKLSDTNSYFLPIHKNEITNSGGTLLQNPYYANQE